MKVVVITGSTRGIGRGLAEAFLARGCAVVVNGRSAASVDEAVADLSGRHDPDRILGQPGDAGDYEQMRGLWDAAVGRWGRVDIWINNAGLGNDQLTPWQYTPETMRAVVEANVLGMLFGSKVAVQGMLAQESGWLYNMEGFGSNGRHREGLSLYGMSKSAVRYFTEDLVTATRETPVRVGALSPGMVVTDLLLDPFEDDPEGFERARGVFNILADRVEDIAPWLADEVLANDKHGRRIQWLTRWRIIGRFLLAPFRRRELFD